jgi:hypothetical protein
MHLQKLLQLVLIALVLAPALVAAPDSVNPVVIDSADALSYRRIWGSPTGCLYLLRRNSFEVRRLTPAKSMVQPLSGNLKLISSENGNYYALINYSSFSPTSLRVTDVRLFDCDGQLIWTKRDPGCNSFILSDNHPVAVGIAGAEGLPDSRLSFFGSDGEQIGTARVQGFNNGRFCESGDFFFAISGEKGLFKFGRSGEELFTYPDCEKYFPGWDGRVVAVGRENQLLIYSDSAVRMSRAVDNPSLREVEISRDNRYAAILTTNQLEVVDIDSNRNVWQYALKDSNFQFFHFSADPSFSYFICATDNAADAPEIRNSRGSVMLLNSKGEVLWQTELAYGEWSVKYPEVKIDLATRIFTLLTAERLQIYTF